MVLALRYATAVGYLNSFSDFTERNVHKLVTLDADVLGYLDTKRKNL